MITTLLASGPKNGCRSTYTRGLSLNEKKQVLDYHNKLRSAVASGMRVTIISKLQCESKTSYVCLGRTSHPRSSNMLELEWDEELSWSAQAHADTCHFGHDCNTCRKLPRWRSVGQNLFQSHRSQSGQNNWKAALDAWFWDEINLFPVSSVYKYSFSHKTGHFSQMVWARTSKVGCGLTEYKLGGWVAK